MKTTFKTFIVVALTFSSKVFAANEIQAVTPAELRQRLEIQSDLYTVDPISKKILAGPHTTGSYRMNAETGKIQGDWSSQFNGHQLFLRYQFTVLESGSIQVSIEEFKNGGAKFTESLEKKDFAIENFEPIVWQSKQKSAANVIVRFIPKLRDILKPIAMDSIPMSGTNVTITDSNGFLWADEVDFGGKYSGFKTHRGALVISYVPFKGAKEIGTAEGKVMRLQPEKNFKIKLISATDFLPSGLTAKVYGIYDPTQKSNRPNSVHGWDSNSEDRINKGFRN